MKLVESKVLRVWPARLKGLLYRVTKATLAVIHPSRCTVYLLLFLLQSKLIRDGLWLYLHETCFDLLHFLFFDFASDTFGEGVNPLEHVLHFLPRGIELLADSN